MRESMKRHLALRVEECYPSRIYHCEGVVLDEIIAQVKEQLRCKIQKEKTTCFEDKQTTMPDAAEKNNSVFNNVRPTLVTGDAHTNDVVEPSAAFEHGLGNIVRMPIQMGNKFQEQFIGKYLSRVFPWALNFQCGGPDYPNLFGDWSKLDQDEGIPEGVFTERWRRDANAPAMPPNTYAQNLAKRVEAQLSGEWMLIPAARNLALRYTALRCALIVHN